MLERGGNHSIMMVAQIGRTSGQGVQPKKQQVGPWCLWPGRLFLCAPDSCGTVALGWAYLALAGRRCAYERKNLFFLDEFLEAEKQPRTGARPARSSLR